MELFICKYCGDVRKGKKSLIGHETFCKNNPNHKIQNTELARAKGRRKVECKWCKGRFAKTNINKHQNACKHNPVIIESKTKKCPVCKISFLGESVTCSHSCSNTYFRHCKEGGLQYKDDATLSREGRYRDLCFRYHDKKCIVCGEENIVAVHHLNENHSDNRPENLIPLCPTHHQYCHSNYKHLVDKKVEQYIMEWKLRNIGDEEAGSSAAFGAQRAGFDSRVSDQKSK